jgi:acetyl esterase/lipase
MRSTIKLALALSGWILVHGAVASAAAAKPEVIPLYEGVAPGSESWTQKEGVMEVVNPTLLRPYTDNLVWNVTRPTLTVFRPAKGKGNGAAIVIAPGGGFRVLSFRNEGLQVAEYLAARGYTAFVLKYRLNQMPDDPAEIKKALDAMAAGAAAGANRRPGAAAGPGPGAGPAAGPGAAASGAAGAPPMPRMVLGPVEQLGISDGRRAVELVRSRAAEFGIDTKRVGIIGFSAGGAVSGNTAIGEGQRPDFVGIIYSNVAGPIPTGAPPAFMAAAADDPLSGAMPDLFSRWRAAGATAELHIYATGRHGFGMAQQGLPVDHWMDAFHAWLVQQGFEAKR